MECILFVTVFASKIELHDSIDENVSINFFFSSLNNKS